MHKSWIFVTALSLTLATGVMIGILAVRPATAQVAPRGVFVNLTTGEEDLQKASMALMLASNSLDAGREVTVFLNVHAVVLADQARSELAVYHRSEPVHALLSSLIDKGVTVIACPYCLQMNDLAASDLIDGVMPASGDVFFPPIDDGCAVFSY